MSDARFGFDVFPDETKQQFMISIFSRNGASEGTIFEVPFSQIKHPPISLEAFQAVLELAWIRGRLEGKIE